MRQLSKELKVARMTGVLMFALAGAMAWAACGSHQGQNNLENQNDLENQNNRKRTTWQVTGCSQALSENLTSAQECSPDRLVPAGQDPCREKLYWKYDSVSKVLEVVDFSISHTCCAQLSLEADVSSSGVVLNELDAPPRCRCQCQSTLSTCLRGIEPGVLPFTIRRTQTDATEAARVLFEGKLTLAEGEGVIDLGPSSGPECQNR